MRQDEPVHLLDADVLIAPVLPEHQHHGRARSWFVAGPVFATSPSLSPERLAWSVTSAAGARSGSGGHSGGVATITASTDLPAEVGAALRTNLDLAVETSAFTRHRVRTIVGPGLVSDGVVGHGQRVRWAARLFGVLPVRHTSEIALLEDGADRARFVDTMVSGAFSAYAHEHVLTALPGGGTRQEDTMSWTSPLGPLGRVADAVAVRAVMRHLLDARNAEVVRRLAG